MSKIVQAINAMIANANLITNVMKGNDEIFFLYKGVYKWSIAGRNNGVHLWYYPGDMSLEELASLDSDDWSFHDIPMVHYNDEEIGTKEAKASFQELLTVVTEKVYGIGDVLDDIISSAPPF